MKFKWSFSPHLHDQIRKISTQNYKRREDLIQEKEKCFRQYVNDLIKQLETSLMSSWKNSNKKNLIR